MRPTTKLRAIDARTLDALESLEVIGDEVTDWNGAGIPGSQVAEATLRNLEELRRHVERLEAVVAMALADRGFAVTIERESA